MADNDSAGSPFGDARLEFPVSFELRVIYALAGGEGFPADLARVLGEAIASRPWTDAARRGACVAAARAAFSPQAAWSGLRALYAGLPGGPAAEGAP